MTPQRLLFLPGALGLTQFWEPLAERLHHPAEKVFFGYPGFDSTPPDPAVRSFEDLAAKAIAAIDRPTALIAQSMGGVIAVRAALQKPEFVTHLVLAVTSGGLDTASLGAADWRAAVQEAHPNLPDWFLTDRSDLTAEIPRIEIPTLLLWGDADPISPVAVGRRLEALLPHSELHVVQGGEHDLAYVHAETLAPLIDAHLQGRPTIK